MKMLHTLIDAERWIASSPPQDIDRLISLCLAIQEAERELIRRADSYLKICMDHCEGLCCKNVFLGEIIGFEDFCYILLLNPELFESLRNHLGQTQGLFTSDCPFLLHGSGPCVLPEAVRPEICITSFCMQTPKADPAIRRVKSLFRKLGWSIRANRVCRFFQATFKVFHF